MKSGKLDRLIRIENFQEIPNEYGGFDLVWSKLADVRAQIVQATTEEFIRAYGAMDETVIIFRIRFIDGVSNGMRVLYQDDPFNIKEIKELGRRQGLEIRCVRQA